MALLWILWFVFQINPNVAKGIVDGATNRALDGCAFCCLQNDSVMRLCAPPLLLNSDEAVGNPGLAQRIHCCIPDGWIIALLFEYLELPFLLLMGRRRVRATKHKNTPKDCDAQQFHISFSTTSA